MNLREYLDKKKMTYRAFAERLGVHVQTIKNIACGSRTPGLKLALRIEEHTEGEVTPRSFFEKSEKASESTLKRKSFKRKIE